MVLLVFEAFLIAGCQYQILVSALHSKVGTNAIDAAQVLQSKAQLMRFYDLIRKLLI